MSENLEKNTKPARNPDTKNQPKKIIVCCDGTGQRSRPPVSNVRRIFNCIKEDKDNMRQEKLYQRGIGTGKLNPFGPLQQATGAGIERKIRKAYRFICEKYETDQDEIYLIGYSRGAYTVRCVAQFIQDAGLLDLTQSGSSDLRGLFSEWKKNGSGIKPSFLAKYSRRSGVRIKVCAVWDTVSALGIPRPAHRAQPGSALMEFVNSGLSGNIDHAFQAIALHEHRRHFLPIVWKSNDVPMSPGSLEQCWFAGYHCDIGGGRKEEFLAHIALIWMMAKLAVYLNFNVESLWKVEPEKRRWWQDYRLLRIFGWRVTEEVKPNGDSQTPDPKSPPESGPTEGVAETVPSQIQHPPKPPQDRRESLPKEKGKATPAHRKQDQIKDSFLGIFRAGGSKHRKPRCHFWEPGFLERKPEADNSNEKIHPTVHAMLDSRSIGPCSSLTGIQPQGGPPQYTWNLRWESDGIQAEQYPVLEDDMSSQEERWLEQWARKEHGKMLKESETGDPRPNTEIPVLLYNFYKKKHGKGK